MNFAKFLLNTNNEYNGHKQTEIANLSIKQGLKLCKKLRKETNGEYAFVMEVWDDGSYTIYQKDYFPKGSPHGEDRIILGVLKSG